MTRLNCLPISMKASIKLNELTIEVEMFCTFLGEPEFRKSFLERWMSTTERGAKTCMILLKWNLPLISMHLDCLLDFTKASWMLIRKSLPKKCMEMKKTRVVSLLHILTTRYMFYFQGVCFCHYCLIHTRNNNAFSGFNLSSHYWKFIFLIVTRTAPFASYLDSEWKCKTGIDTPDISLESDSFAKRLFSAYFSLEKLSDAESEWLKSKNESSQL